jgi:hypothetical protein
MEDAAAMILVEDNLRIVHANAAGHTLLSEGGVLRAAGGKLATVDPQADSELCEIIVNAEDADAAHGGRAIGVPLSTRDGQRYVAHVLPLTSGSRRKAKVAYSAIAAVFVRKAEFDAPHPINAGISSKKPERADKPISSKFLQTI